MSELKPPETSKRRAPKTAFKKGQSGNPGGQSKEKREFLEQLRDAEGDAKKVYRAFMKLIAKGNAPAILWAMGHIVGKPPDKVELTGKDGKPIATDSKVKHVIDSGRIARILSVLQRAGALQAGDADDAEADEVHPVGANGDTGSLPPS